MENFEELKRAYREWLSKKAAPRSIAVTVTFAGSGRQLHLAEQDVRLYCRMLNKKAFGLKFSRGERQLRIIAVREGGSTPREKRLHYHMCIEVPEPWSIDDWMQTAEDRLTRIKAFGIQYCIKPVRDDGWLEYILKDRDKKSFADAVDVANLWVN